MWSNLDYEVKIYKKKDNLNMRKNYNLEIKNVVKIKQKDHWKSWKMRHFELLRAFTPQLLIEKGG